MPDDKVVRLTTRVRSGRGSPGGASCLTRWKACGSRSAASGRLSASSPEKLTEQVEAATRGEAGPDEGEKTQGWRTLRRHERG